MNVASRLPPTGVEVILIFQVATGCFLQCGTDLTSRVISGVEVDDYFVGGRLRATNWEDAKNEKGLKRGLSINIKK